MKAKTEKASIARKKRMIALLLSALMLAAFGCTPRNPAQNGNESCTGAPSGAGTVNLSAGVKANSAAGRAADDAFITAQTDFAVRLFQSALKKGENSLVSPLSVMLALAMSANGADGQTLAEMEKVLGGLKIAELNEYLVQYAKQLVESEKSELSFANSVWIRDDIAELVENAFLQKCVDNYGADVFSAPFERGTVDRINGWVGEKTNGLVDRLIEKIADNTSLFVINALFFGAEWQNKYKTNEIGSGSFNAINGKKRRVTMMNSAESRYLEDEKAVGFIKPYSDERFAFAALLPNEGVNIVDYIESLNGERLSGILNGASYASVIAAMPKFSFENNIKLKDALKAMGMELAFDHINAGFSNLIGAGSVDGNTYIGEVHHGAKIEVTEQGTRAGAATAVEFLTDCAVFPQRVITLDRPFVFMIIDTETNIPLFIGALTDVD